MAMKYIKSSVISVALLLISIAAGAQALPFTASEYGASSLGKAGADLVDTDNTAMAAFTNAAAITFSEDRLDSSVGYTLWTPTSSNVITAGASFNLNKLGVAAAVHYGINPAYSTADGNGSVTGTFTPSDMQIAAGVAYKVLPILSIGANLGYATSTLSEKYSYGAFKADVFAMAKIAGLKATLGVRNLGTSVTSASGDKFSLPSSVALGAGYGLTVAKKHSINVLVDADYYFSGAIAVAAGVEYGMNDFLFVRGGYRYGGESPVPSYASVGLGVKKFGCKLNVAYLLGSQQLGNTLSVGLGYAF